MSKLEEIELFNVQEGDSTFVPMVEREKAPTAEYFTAEKKVTEDEAAEGIKRITLTFRKIAKDGSVYGVAAGMHNGKLVLFDSGQSIGDDLLGVLVRAIFHYE